MKRYMKNLVINGLMMGIALTLTSYSANAQTGVCGRGVSEPPFLAYGVNSNLLLLLDNSGSMLDIAYLDPDNQCFDETYLVDPDNSAQLNSDIEYAGYFAKDSWYLWIDNPNATRGWESNASYTNGELIFDNGVFYRSDCGGNATCTSSTASSIEKDEIISWIPLGGASVQEWQNNVVFPNNSFVKQGTQLYYTIDGGTANGTNPMDDTGILWEPVDHTWLPDTSYGPGDIVTYKGMLYRAVSSAPAPFTSSYYTLFEDYDPATGTSYWERLDEGYFMEYTGAGDPCPNYSYAQNLPAANSSIPINDIQITLQFPLFGNARCRKDLFPAEAPGIIA
ncbi:MAG: hypothetical protein ACWGN1_04155 [Desulfobulbales bacterium]